MTHAATEVVIENGVLFRRVSGSFVVTVPAPIRRVLQWEDKDKLIVRLYVSGTTKTVAFTRKRKPSQRKRRTRRRKKPARKATDSPQAPRTDTSEG